MSEGLGPSAPVVAIVGATGAVGVELIRCLEERAFPLSELRLFASARSAGKTLKFRGQAPARRERCADLPRRAPAVSRWRCSPPAALPPGDSPPLPCAPAPR